jgi:hypothetical protein
VDRPQLAMSALSGAHCRWSPRKVFGWRHWVGVLRSLAFSHGVHAVAIAALAWQTRGKNLVERGALVILGGAIAYVFILLGAVRPRSRIVSLGLFWTWGVFLVSYVPRALRMPLPYGFAVVLLVVAMVVRLGAVLDLGVAER